MYNTSVPQEQGSSNSSSNHSIYKASSCIKLKVKNRPKMKRGNNVPVEREVESSTITLEEYKALNSKILSKLHEEAGLRLKDIRTLLNALDLQRQPPKQKKKKNRKAFSMTIYYQTRGLEAKLESRLQYSSR